MGKNPILKSEMLELTNESAIENNKVKFLIGLIRN